MSIGFHELKVAGVRPEINGAVSLALEVPPELRCSFRFEAGQHLTLRAEIDGEEVRRNYSLCAAPHENEWRVAIKRVPGGLFSDWANTVLRPGDTILAMPPHGSFTWHFDPSRSAHYVAFAAGSGITPILSLIKTALMVEPQSRITLIYGNRDSSSIMFLEELSAIKDKFIERFQMFNFLSAEDEEVELFNGRLDSAKIAEVLEELIDSTSIDAAFICGPGPMMDAAEAALIAAGVAKDHILAERFTVGPMTREQAERAAELERAAAGHQVEVTLNGRRRRVAFDPSKGSILDNARAAGMPAPFACKSGVCSTCRAKVVSGRVEMKANYGLSETEVAEGYVLTCQAVPLSDDVSVDYDR